MQQNVPIAYFLTFVTYGSHVPGGETVSISKHQNTVDQPTLGYRPGLEATSRALMVHSEVRLDREMRRAVESAVFERCRFKNWQLHALNVRTNHVHAVLSAEHEPHDAVLQQLKACSTRRLRELGLATGDSRIWARHGSTRMIWTEADLADRVDYVLFCQ